MRKARSLRERLTLMILGVAAPAVVAMGCLVVLSMVEAHRSQERALLATARAVSSAVDMDLARARVTAEALASSDAVADRDWPRVAERAGELGLGRHSWVSITDASGARLLTTSGDDDGTVRSRPRPVLQATRGDQRLPVSDLFTDAPSGRQVVAIDTPTPDDEALVASVVLDPARFLGLFTREVLPRSSMVTIVDGEQRVIARSRDHATHLGALATPPMRAALDAAREGVVPSRSLDGERTVVAYVTSRHSGWTAMVVVPRERFEAPIWTSVGGVTVLLVLFVGISLVVATRQSGAISGELDALERDVRALSRGETVALRPGRILNFDRVQEGVSKASHELERRQERQTLLIHELNHRVKNTLATVQALAAQTFRGSDAEARVKFERRLAALGGAHDLLTQTTWSEIDIRDVVARCGEQPDERMTSSGPSILLPPEAALALCMCIHELTTNSLKYGALSRPEGRADVRWSLTQDAGLSFQWRETGGPRVTPPTREGFGSRLMERLARHELNGEIERIYEPDGLVAIGRFRLPERSRWRTH